MQQPVIIPLEITEPPKKKPVKKKNKLLALGEVVSGGVQGMFAGFTNLFKSKKSADAPRNQKIIDNRTGGMSMSYLIAILVVVVLVIVIMWVGIKKIKAKK